MQTELFVQWTVILNAIVGICNIDCCFYMVLHFTIEYAMLM